MIDAKQQPKSKIPIILNLASWRQEKDLITWITEEIGKKYQIINHEYIDYMVKNSYFIFLFDALDEVLATDRVACLKTINAFSNPKVISCRTDDYHHLCQNAEDKLKLGRAIELQALSEQQIDEYLAQFGNELFALRHILANEAQLSEREEKTFYQLLSTPLFLHIAVLVFENSTVDELSKARNLSQWQAILWDSYIEKAILRKQGIKPKQHAENTPEKTLRWLKNIALGMKKSNQSELIPELIYHRFIEAYNFEKQYSSVTGTLPILIYFSSIVWLFISAFFKLVVQEEPRQSSPRVLV